ncbi:hypothetical protein [Cellulomonas humilata]|uniref:Uncharacterized protein n=1 Tax=Cellulomonas humilata TaxID=144055 RepID=A0ABU0EFT4_9CELL|nr:hypothetical protein [Cellulomonas humilata]MDQ0373911.1 hypothetical protein [Cellulomonas humilata]
MPIKARSIEILRDLDQGIVIYDGGPSRNKQLEQNMLADLEVQLGGTARVRAYARTRCAPLAFLEADWIASSMGVHHVHYNVGAGGYWPWLTITMVETRRKAARLHFHSRQVLDLGMNRYAALALA